MSAEYVEFLKRGRREYKVLEAIVKGWKAKAVEVASEAPPKKRATHASKTKATDVCGTDASIKVHVHDILLALLLKGGACFSAWLSTCFSPRPLSLLCLLCAAHPA
jgi:hypothetical protein